LGTYILIRFFLIIPTIFILVTLVFFLMRVIGDPITAAQGGRLPPEALAQRIHDAGYDRPILVQYLEYVGQVATGNFGTTITDRRPVVEMIITFGTATLELAINALIVALLVGASWAAAQSTKPSADETAGNAALADGRDDDVRAFDPCDPQPVPRVERGAGRERLLLLRRRSLHAHVCGMRIGGFRGVVRARGRQRREPQRAACRERFHSDHFSSPKKVRPGYGWNT